MGNQQSSLVGQMCFEKGQTKNTYRNACFLMCNIGEKVQKKNEIIYVLIRILTLFIGILENFVQAWTGDNGGLQNGQRSTDSLCT